MIEAYGRITPPQAQQTDNAWALPEGELLRPVGGHRMSEQIEGETNGDNREGGCRQDRSANLRKPLLAADQL